MQKTFRILCFSMVLCLNGCNSSVSKVQLAEFSKTDSSTDLKNQKIKNTSSRSPVTWRTITPKSTDSVEKLQYNSNLELADQAFESYPTKFTTKKQIFSSKSTDYDKTPEEIMNSGDFKRVEDRETAIRALYVDPLSERPQKDLNDYDPFADHKAFYSNIAREKALGLK